MISINISFVILISKGNHYKNQYFSTSKINIFSRFLKTKINIQNGHFLTFFWPQTSTFRVLFPGHPLSAAKHFLNHEWVNPARSSSLFCKGTFFSFVLPFFQRSPYVSYLFSKGFLVNYFFPKISLGHRSTFFPKVSMEPFFQRCLRPFFQRLTFHAEAFSCKQQME